MMEEQTTAEIEVFVAVNEDGEYEVGIDENEAGERLDENQGGYQRRVFALKLTVPLPKPAEVSAVLPEREGQLSLEIREPSHAG
jgi:hypothetical protein